MYKPGLSRERLARSDPLWLTCTHTSNAADLQQEYTYLTCYSGSLRLLFTAPGGPENTYIYNQPRSPAANDQVLITPLPIYPLVELP